MFLMANWDKLNKEFDECLANLTDEEFQKWYDERLTNRKKRRFEMKHKAKMITWNKNKIIY